MTDFYCQKLMKYLKKTLSKLLLIFFFIYSQALYARQYSHSEALDFCAANNLSMPAPQSDGRVQTLNEFGAMSPTFDTATMQFIENSAGKKVLEIGAGYGKVMAEVLSKNPATEYHINDLDERHLFIAAKNLATKLATHNLSDNKISPQIQYLPGDISNKNFVINDKYDAILIARVMHFFDPQQMDLVIAKIAQALKPNGRVYVVAITPYVKRYQAFIPVYEQRLATNEAYPGYVESLRDWLNVEVTSTSQQTTISKGAFMFLDDRILIRAFSKAGLKIICSATEDLGYPSESWSLDGRENVTLIAEKA